MKKLYTVLATLMFLCFVLIAGSLMLNKQIEKVISIANSKVDVATRNFNNGLDGHKIVHNLYFVNCFPNVCAKASFATLISKESVFDVVSQKEVSEKTRRDIGLTSYIIVKYSPLTGDVIVDLGPNNVIINENGKKFASAYFEGLNYELSSDVVSYYKTLIFGKDESADTLYNTKGNSSFNVKGLKVAIEDLRVKAEDLTVVSDIYNPTETTVSSLLNFDVKGISVDNSDEKTDIVYNINVENFSKNAVIDGAKLARERVKALTSGKNPEDLKDESIINAFNYISSLLSAVSDFDKNKTKIVLSDLSVKEYDESKDSKVLSDIKMKFDLSLDANLDPKGSINIEVFTENIEDMNVITKTTFRAPKTGKTYNLYKQLDNGGFGSNIIAENGYVVINDGEKIDVKGLGRKVMDFAYGVLSIVKMQAIAAQ